MDEPRELVRHIVVFGPLWFLDYNNRGLEGCAVMLKRGYDFLL